MSRESDLSSPSIVGLPWTARRNLLSLASLLLGVLGSGLLLIAGAQPGAVLVPISFGILGALASCPFPVADRWLAIAILATLPLLPPSSLPNLPLAAAVIPIALLRVVVDGGWRLDRRVVIALAIVWGSIALGAALSNWPSPSMWLRPVAILAIAAPASLLGALVWRDHRRRARWLDGLSLGLLLIAVTALLVFALQYFVPIRSIVTGLTTSIEYLRGEGAAVKFESQNNWVIWGEVLTLRAFSPFFPAPTNTGGFIGIAGPIVAAHWLVLPAGPWRRVAGMAIFTAATVVLVSFSRSTWLAAAAAVAVVAVVAVLYGPIRKVLIGTYRRRLTMLAGIAVLGVAVGLVGVLSVGTEASDVRITGMLEDPSVTTRIDIDRGAAEAFNADMLRGAGLGNWEATLEVRTGKAYVHNVYLEYAAAAGIFGLIWSILLMVFLLGSAGVIVRWAVDPAQVITGLGIALAGVFTATQFMFDDNLLNPQYTWLLAWLVGGSLGLAAVVTLGTARPRES